jgi:hypothetical protein
MGRVLGVYMFVFGLFAALPLVDPNRYRSFVYPVITFFVLKALLMLFYAEVLLEEMHVSLARLSVQTFGLLVVAVGLYFSRPRIRLESSKTRT